MDCLVILLILLMVQYASLPHNQASNKSCAIFYATGVPVYLSNSFLFNVCILYQTPVCQCWLLCCLNSSHSKAPPINDCIAGSIWRAQAKSIEPVNGAGFESFAAKIRSGKGRTSWGPQTQMAWCMAWCVAWCVALVCGLVCGFGVWLWCVA